MASSFLMLLKERRKELMVELRKVERMVSIETGKKRRRKRKYTRKTEKKTEKTE